jgi:hypothetical protein
LFKSALSNLAILSSPRGRDAHEFSVLTEYYNSTIKKKYPQVRNFHLSYRQA